MSNKEQEEELTLKDKIIEWAIIISISILASIGLACIIYFVFIKYDDYSDRREEISSHEDRINRLEGEVFDVDVIAGTLNIPYSRVRDNTRNIELLIDDYYDMDLDIEDLNPRMSSTTDLIWQHAKPFRYKLKE